MKKTSKVMCCNLLTAAIVAIFMFAFSFSAHAATVNEPYGFTYPDSINNRTVYHFSVYTDGAYKSFKEFYSKGSYVYSGDGRLICNTSKGAGSMYQGYDAKGNFYIINKDGSILVVSTQNKTSVLIKSGAMYLNYNESNIATTVKTTSGNKYLSNLESAPEEDNDTFIPETPVKKPANRVDIYTNSANELVYDAFKSGNLKYEIIVSKNGKSVLNVTNNVRLTDSLIGSAFIGFDSNYNVYLYESNSLYRFTAGKWFSAEKMALNGTYKGFKKDDNGFITKIVTSKSSYTIKQLTTSSKWKAKKTYTVKKSGYVTLYTKGSTKSNTLTLKSSQLSLNGKKIATGISKYGFVSSKKLIYMKGKKVYTASLSNPKKAKLLSSSGKALYTNSIGLVYKFSTTKGTKKVS